MLPKSKNRPVGVANNAVPSIVTDTPIPPHAGDVISDDHPFVEVSAFTVIWKLTMFRTDNGPSVPSVTIVPLTPPTPPFVTFEGVSAGNQIFPTLPNGFWMV